MANRPDFPTQEAGFATEPDSIVSRRGVALDSSLSRGFTPTQPVVGDFNYIVKNIYDWTQYLNSQVGQGSMFTHTYKTATKLIQIPFELAGTTQSERTGNIEVLKRGDIMVGASDSGNTGVQTVTIGGGTGGFSLSVGSNIYSRSSLTIRPNSFTRPNNFLRLSASSSFFRDPQATQIFEALSQTGTNIFALSGNDATGTVGYIDNIAINSVSKYLEGLTLNAGLDNSFFNRFFYKKSLGRASTTIYLVAAQSEAEANAGRCIIYPLNLGQFRSDPSGVASFAIEFQNSAFLFYKQVGAYYSAIDKDSLKENSARRASSQNVVGVDSSSYYIWESGRLSSNIRKRALGSNTNTAGFVISYDSSSESPLYGTPVVGSSFYPVITRSGQTLILRAYANGTQTRQETEDITLNFFGSAPLADGYDYSATTSGDNILFSYVQRPSSGSSQRNTYVATFRKPASSGATRTSTTRRVDDLTAYATGGLSVYERWGMGVVGDSSAGLTLGGNDGNYLPGFDRYSRVGNNRINVRRVSSTAALDTGLTTRTGISARSDMGMVGSPTSGAVFGGRNDGGTGGTVQYFNDFFQYAGSDSVTTTLLAKTGTISARSDMGMVGDADSGLIFGGRGSSGDLNDFVKYEVSSGTVTLTTLTKAGATIAARSGMGMVGSETSGIIFGGLSGSSYLSDFYKYEVSGGTVTITSLTKRGVTIAGTSDMGMLGDVTSGLIFGGRVTGGYLINFYKYSVSGNSITLTAATHRGSIPSRGNMGMIGSASDALIFGGTRGARGSALTDFYRYVETTTLIPPSRTVALVPSADRVTVDGSSGGLFPANAGEAVKLSFGEDNILYIASSSKTAFYKANFGATGGFSGSAWVSDDPRFFNRNIRPVYDQFTGSLSELRYFRTANAYTGGSANNYIINLVPPSPISIGSPAAYSFAGYRVSLPVSGRHAITVTLGSTPSYTAPVASGVVFTARTYASSMPNVSTYYEYRHTSYTGDTLRRGGQSFGSKIPPNDTLAVAWYFPTTYQAVGRRGAPSGTLDARADRFGIAIPNRYIDFAGNPTSFSIGETQAGLVNLTPLVSPRSLVPAHILTEDSTMFYSPPVGSGNSALRPTGTDSSKFVKVLFNDGYELNLNTAPFRYLLIQDDRLNDPNTLATLDALNALYKPTDRAFVWPNQVNPTPTSAMYNFVFQGGTAGIRAYDWTPVNPENYAVEIYNEITYLNIKSGVSNDDVLIIRKRAG